MASSHSTARSAAKDALFEALIATRTPGRKQTDTLLHENIFRPLFSAIFAKGESRAAFVKRYLKDWYGAFRRAYWHDSHKGPEGGGFFGYWAVEVAGVVEAFGMDDAAFRDMPYYPRDFVRRRVAGGPVTGAPTRQRRAD